MKTSLHTTLLLLALACFALVGCVEEEPERELHLPVLDGSSGGAGPRGGGVSGGSTSPAPAPEREEVRGGAAPAPAPTSQAAP